MRICVVQSRPVKGDIQRNIGDHKRYIDQAVSNGADIVIFPELSLTGYEPTLAEELATIPEDSRLDDFQTISNAHQITIGVGLPARNETGICISMILFQPNKPRQMYSKKYLHVDEDPFFVSGQNFPSLRVNEANVGLAICYELSIPEHAEAAYRCGAEMYIASVAKSAAGVNQANKRLADIASNYSIPVFISNCVGPSDDFVSAGNTAVWNEKGVLLGQLNDTDEGLIIYDLANQELIEKYV